MGTQALDVRGVTRQTETSTYAKAIGVIHRQGWTQGTLQDASNGSVCTVGALNIACHGNTQSCTADRHDHYACGWFDQLPLLAAIGMTYRSLEDWNDAPHRTVEDVLLLLKYAHVEELATWRQLYA